MNCKVLTGDCLDVLKTLPDESAQCCVTSPPYWGLRDYGVDGQLGLEPTPELYVEHLVAVFREVRRVLRKDGVLFLNLGDSYASDTKGSSGTGKSTLVGTPNEGNGQLFASRRMALGTLKPKDLVGIPWRVAFALQADGWWIRSDIIWSKTNPMPESVTDRPTKSHEYVFLLTKSAHYYYDALGISEPLVGKQRPRTKNNGESAVDTKLRGYNSACGSPNTTRNARSVWQINTTPYKGSHFATMPVKLAERCVLAGTSTKGCCAKCGAPWERVEERTAGAAWQRQGYTAACGARNDGDRPGSYEGTHITHLGWRHTCACDAGEPVPCTVLDPFGGAGTTALAAIQNGRDCIIIELNDAYVALIEERLSAVPVRMAGVRA